jgi:FdhD protein
MPEKIECSGSDHETVRVVRVGDKDSVPHHEDSVAVEEPLEIRLGLPEAGAIRHRPVSITMRTPGNDFELAAGFLFTEGILGSSSQIAAIRHCGTGASASNTVRVDLVAGVEVEINRLERNFYTTSSCGVCGKSSLEALSTGAKRVTTDPGLRVARGLLMSLPERLRERQSTFEVTGGLHAAGLFSSDGELIALREDVGRHNAVDKLIGHRFMTDSLPAADGILVLSGRASFELLQKAVMAGIGVVCAVGAPSSLAVRTAEEFGVTLIGFLRDSRFNIYSNPERVALD